MVKLAAERSGRRRKRNVIANGGGVSCVNVWKRCTARPGKSVNQIVIDSLTQREYHDHYYIKHQNTRIHRARAHVPLWGFQSDGGTRGTVHCRLCQWGHVVRLSASQPNWFERTSTCLSLILCPVPSCNSLNSCLQTRATSKPFPLTTYIQWA